VRGNEGGEQGTITLFLSALISLLRSVTLVGEADRKMLKAAIKRSSGEDQVRHRIIPAETIQTYVERLAGLNGEIAEILKEEKEEKQVRSSALPSFFFPVLKLLSFTAEKGRNGTKKGRKHD